MPSSAFSLRGPPQGADLHAGAADQLGDGQLARLHDLGQLLLADAEPLAKLLQAEQLGLARIAARAALGAPVFHEVGKRAMSAHFNDASCCNSPIPAYQIAHSIHGMWAWCPVRSTPRLAMVMISGLVSVTGFCPGPTTGRRPCSWRATHSSVGQSGSNRLASDIVNSCERLA